MSIPVFGSERGFRLAVKALLESSAGGLSDLQAIAATLQSRRWEDLRFPAQGINPAGSTEPPAVDTDDGTLIFAGNKDCILAGFAQMPHAWEEGRPIHPHIHLQFKTSAAANTRWKLEYQIANVNADFPGTWTSETITCANPQNVLKHCIFS